MNRTERALWERIRGLMPGASDRVENSATTGFPDAYGDYEKTSYWAELKVYKGNKVLCEERLWRLLRGSQVVWLHRHVREGAVALLVVGFKSRVEVYRVWRRMLVDLADESARSSLYLMKCFVIIGGLTSEAKLYFTVEMRKAILDA